MAVSLVLGAWPSMGIWETRSPAKEMRERREMVEGLDAIVAGLDLGCRRVSFGDRC